MSDKISRGERVLALTLSAVRATLVQLSRVGRFLWLHLSSFADLILNYSSRFTFLITEIILPLSPQFHSMGMETSHLSF